MTSMTRGFNHPSKSNFPSHFAILFVGSKCRKQLNHMKCQFDRVFSSIVRLRTLGPIHTGCGTQRAMQRKQMGPVDVNGGVHTAHKQRQRENILICWHIASCVLCGLGLSKPSGLSESQLDCCRCHRCRRRGQHRTPHP